MHDAPGEIGLPDRGARVRTDLRREYGGNVELGRNTEQQRGHPSGVTVGELGDVAGAHEDRGVGQALAQSPIANDGLGEAEVYGIEYGVDEELAALPGHDLGRAIQRIHVARLLGNQNRHRVSTQPKLQRAFGQTEQVVGTALRAAQQIIGLQGIDTDFETFALERVDRVFHMVERLSRQTTDVDDVRAIAAVAHRSLHDLADGTLRRIDDLGKDAEDDSRRAIRRAPRRRRTPADP